MIIVVDRFDEKGRLKHLMPRFPLELDMRDYLNEDNKHIAPYSEYRLGGFITQDPLHLDYTVCLKNKNREKQDKDSDWVSFNKRGIQRYTTDQIFSKDSINNA